MYYIYVLQSGSDLYYGYTEDLRRRVQEHNSGKSRHTKGKRWKLVYYEAYLATADARRREAQLKQYGQALS